MSDRASFPGSYQGDEGLRADRQETWKEYQGLLTEAGHHSQEAMVKSGEGDPRRGQIHATLAVAAQLQALTYIISKAKAF